MNLRTLETASQGELESSGRAGIVRKSELEKRLIGKGLARDALDEVRQVVHEVLVEFEGEAVDAMEEVITDAEEEELPE